LKQLIGLGYVEEITTKRDSNYSVYRLVKEAFHQINGQHNGQVKEQKTDQPNEQKRETEIKENRDVKGTIVDSHSPFSENQNEDLICLRAFCENHLLQIYDKSLSRWLSKYSSTHICDHLSLLIEGKDKIKKHEAWMEKALNENYVQKNKNVQANRNYIQKFLEDHKWNDLKITTAYCVHLPSEKDYRFDLSPENFQRMISECFELHNK
jgi:hypothetical protein